MAFKGKCSSSSKIILNNQILYFQAEIIAALMTVNDNRKDTKKKNMEIKIWKTYFFPVFLFFPIILFYFIFRRQSN